MLERQPWLVVAALAAGALGFTHLMGHYVLFVVGNIATLVTVTLGLGLLVGTVGILSLASPAFLAIGAYGAILLVNELSVPVLLSVPAITAFAGALGYGMGLISLRLTGFHLAIVTLAFTSVLLVALKTGGPLVGDGYGLIAPVPQLSVLGDFDADLAARFAIVTSVLAGGAVYCVVRSQIGRAWFALKSNDTAAAMLGIEAPKLRSLGFALSSAIIALAGSFQGFILGVTSPKSYDIPTAISHIALVVVAGMNGSVVGAFCAPFLLFLLPELYPELGHWREVFFGCVLLIVLAVRPERLSAALRGFLSPGKDTTR